MSREAAVAHVNESLSYIPQSNIGIDTAQPIQTFTNGLIAIPVSGFMFVMPDQIKDTEANRTVQG